jgi:co-chaperonin GroES (HSP10)
MGKKVRLNLTDNEKLARDLVGLESQATHMNLANVDDLDTMIAKQKASNFNNQVGDYMEKIDKHSELLKQYTESIKENMNSVEIKPMLTRVLIKPFEINPFQQIKVADSGLIIDTGGFAPEVFSNDTGQWEEQQQAIGVGTVYDAGPECKYVKEGDAVYYQRAAMVPVPFFKQGLVTVAESQIIAVVNEGLTERFNKIKK